MDKKRKSASTSDEKIKKIQRLLGQCVKSNRSSISLTKDKDGSSSFEENCIFPKNNHKEELLLKARNAYDEGNYHQARELCLEIKEDSNQVDPERLLLLGAIAYKLAQYEESIEHNMACVRADKNFAEAAACEFDFGNTKKAVQSYQYAIELIENNLSNCHSSTNDISDMYTNYANCLKESGDRQGAIEIYLKATKLRPDCAIAYENLECGKIKQAISLFHTTISLDPKFSDAYNNLGNAYREDGKLEKAIHCYENALKISPDHAHAMNNLGNAYKDCGETRKAIACYETAIRLAPNLAAANSNLGLVLKERGDLFSAIQHYRQAIAIDQNFKDAYINLGNALKEIGHMDQAIQCYFAAIQIKPDFAEAYSNLASAYKDNGQLTEAVKFYRKALCIRPDFDDAFANLVHSLVFLCDWLTRDDDFEKLRTIIHKQLSGYTLAEIEQKNVQQQAKKAKRDNESIRNSCHKLPSVQPFHTLVYPISNKDILRISQKYADQAWLSAKVCELPIPLYSLMNTIQAILLCPHAPIAHNKSNKRIRIGYVSSDFGNHPLAHLTQSIFGMHDRQRFDIICYALSADDDSQWRRKIQAEVETFIDISKLTIRDSALTIRSHDVDILINLNGYTKGSRNEIFALQPAPIQVSYMGFCGTLGASYVQYIIADNTVIPKKANIYFSEYIIRLPHSYFVNDHAQSAKYMLEEEEDFAVKDVTRAKYGVPSSVTFIFANFNQLYKIDPDIFDVWCRILKRVEGSILWLLRFPPAGEENIRAEARKRGIDDKKQLHFTSISPKDEHIKRGALADLFLDTPQCNAHTTGCDILWGGCPMITILGNKMATRVAASLLNAVGAPELITKNYQHYENLAVDLATNKQKYIQIRTKIQNARLKNQLAPLWDTLRWVRNLEQAYESIWHRFLSNLEPDHIHVHDIGIHNLNRKAYKPYQQDLGPFGNLHPDQRQTSTYNILHSSQHIPSTNQFFVPTINSLYPPQACPQLYVPISSSSPALPAIQKPTLCYHQNSAYTLPSYLLPPQQLHELRAPTHLIHQANLYPPFVPTPQHHFLNTPGMLYPLANNQIIPSPTQIPRFFFIPASNFIHQYQ
uniref:protein O-GlcNAc transferase n=1 Tax=Aureoumbra lagunensis TaxID=44058 RepID=A0A7S3JYI0_9STRA|mmetsp:Transcript_15803/g.23780  ORF Transcript_15803/g.23780 Transcript_15803/m.23780 type:complete len:1093 (+) Transcript_15803:62-3340(+)